MKTLARMALLLVVISALSACHADMLYRIDIHANKTATLTTRATLDDAIYQALLGSGGADPFGLIADHKAGWQVAQRELPDGRHLIVETRTVPGADIAKTLAEVLTGASGGTEAAGVPRVEIAERRQFFSNSLSVHTVIPAILALVQNKSSETPSSAMDDSILESVVAAHFQLRAPGKLVNTNGTLLKNGYVQWDLNWNAPTPIAYVVDVPAVANISMTIVAAFLLLAAALVFIFRKRQPTTSHGNA